MLQNPNPNDSVKKFYNELQESNKAWFEYEDKKFVLIAEKPSQIKALRAVLPKGKHIRIISLAGHIMRLKNFDEYDKNLKNKTWFEMVKNKDIPFIPDTFESIVKEKPTSGKFKTDYKDLFLNLKRATDEADFIISVADPDNEGCSLVYQPVKKAGNEGKILGQINMSKLDFHSLSQEIKSIDKIPFYNMAQSGMARSEFDWAFGLNNTILASVLLGSGKTYHIGGVKTPVTRMVIDRLNHIEKFKPVKYWHFHGIAKHIKSNTEFKFIVKIKCDKKEILSTEDKINELENKLKEIDKENAENKAIIDNIYENLSKLKWKLNELKKDYESSEKDIFSITKRKEIENIIKAGSKFKVSEFIKINNLSQNPPLAYSLTDLQAEAGNIYNYTPAKTLQLAQKLYESQFQSYPRTDNRYYALGEMANVKKIIPNLLKLNSFKNVNIPEPYKVKTGVFNSSKISAHTGLAPTSKEINDKSLTDELKNIYEMVATRYLIQFMDKFEYYKVEMNSIINDDLYITAYQNIQTKKGWRELYNPSNMFGFVYTEQQTLPNMEINDEIEILSIKRENLETKPKPMFTEFSLLKGMENISRIYPELEGLEKGIGTPATRASILDALFKSKYLLKKGKVIQASDKAKKLIQLIPDDMSNPKLRADMEAKLNLIVNGELAKSDYEKEVKKMVEEQATNLYEIAKKNNIQLIDKATLSPTDAQLKFAKTISKELNVEIPEEALKLKDNLTKWIKKYEKNMPQLLSDKQLAFLKEYGQDNEEIVEIVKAHENRKLTKEQKFKASKWLGSYMRTSEYQKKKARKSAMTRKKNREAKMKALGIEIPDVKIPKRKPRKKKKITEDKKSD